MRISEIEIVTCDINWFAVDNKGHIAEFFSGGNEIPEFVAESKEDLEKLQSYFESLGTDFSAVKTLSYDAFEDCITEATKGIICYDTLPGVKVDYLKYNYIRKSIPENCLKVYLLPNEIQQLLNKCKINIDFLESDTLEIEVNANEQRNDEL